MWVTFRLNPRTKTKAPGQPHSTLLKRWRARGLSALTLNVFRDNPALALYERHGFYCIDTQFYKYKMRKMLHQRTDPT
jgi:hypothetical protein